MRLDCLCRRLLCAPRKYSRGMCDRRLRGKIGMSSPLNEKEDGGEKMEKIVEGQSV